MESDWLQMGICKEKGERYKNCQVQSRLVTQGFSQKPETNYLDNGTFALVMCFKTLRTMLANSAIYNWKLRQFDIKGAYLHRELKKKYT